VTNEERRENLAWKVEINESKHRKQLGKKFCNSLGREVRKPSKISIASIFSFFSLTKSVFPIVRGYTPLFLIKKSGPININFYSGFFTV